MLWRAIASEWTRLWTVRSTWWSLLAATVLMLILGLAVGYDERGPTPIWLAGEFAIVPTQFALLTFAMLTVTSEYATGAIRTSLLWVPRRGILLLSRATVSVVVATATGVVLAFAADVASWVALGADAEVVTGDIAVSLAAVAVVVASGALLTVGLANVLRSSAGTMTAVFLLLLVLPIMLTEFGVAWLDAVAASLPGHAAISFLRSLAWGMELDGGTAAAVLMAWTGTATVAGAWSLLRQDAT